MDSVQQRAHRRLLEILPVRSVECRDDNRTSSGGKAKPVEVEGRAFASLTEAARALGITKQAIVGRIKSKTARHL